MDQDTRDWLGRIERKLDDSLAGNVRFDEHKARQGPIEIHHAPPCKPLEAHIKNSALEHIESRKMFWVKLGVFISLISALVGIVIKYL